MISCTQHGSSDSILMVNGSERALSEGESLAVLDEAELEKFTTLIGAFRQEPQVALYRSVRHADYGYFLALPTDNAQWNGKEFECEPLITDSLQLHLANRLIDGQNRLIILHHSLQDEDSRVCEDLEGRSTAIISAE